MGNTKVREIVRRCASDNDVSYDYIIENPSYTLWLDYIKNSDRGDINYMSHTGSYIKKEVFVALIKTDMHVKK